MGAILMLPPGCSATERACSCSTLSAPSPATPRSMRCGGSSPITAMSWREAARLLGGVAAEARVISCGMHLENATRIDSRIRRDLVAFHRLLGLHDVGDPDRIETELFSAISPSSPHVETICILTDLLEDLLRAIEDDPAASCAAARDDSGAIAA